MAKIRIRRANRDKKKIIIIALVLGLIIVLTSIFLIWKFDLFKNDSKVVIDKTGINITKPTIQETKPIEEKINIVDVNSKSRPFAVMINNISVARPYQSGLQDAYLIYEIIVEGGITRYLALFKDQNTERIGTVRSARHYYLDYVLENDAYFVHWGWSEQAQNDISDLKINNINGLTYSNKYFWKDNSLPVATEHRGYTSMEKLKEAVSKLKYRDTTDKGLLLNYSIDEVELDKMPNAQVANNVSIKYSNSITTSYTYDKEKGYYYRSVNNKVHTDYVTKEQYHFKNIITYKLQNSTIPGDTKGRQNLNNITSGTGYYISNGYAVPIKFEKTSRSGKTKYYFENGEELQVNDGNTFIQIQPMKQTLTIN